MEQENAEGRPAIAAAVVVHEGRMLMVRRRYVPYYGVRNGRHGTCPCRPLLRSEKCYLCCPTVGERRSAPQGTSYPPARGEHW